MARSGEKPWRLWVRIPKTAGGTSPTYATELTIIYHTYTCIPTKTQKSNNLAKKTQKNLTRCSKKHCRPPENSVYKLRKTNIPFYEQIVPPKGIFILTLKIFQICSGQGAWQINPTAKHILRQFVKGVRTIGCILKMWCVHFYIWIFGAFCYRAQENRTARTI
jgi:hypothetical protein